MIVIDETVDVPTPTGPMRVYVYRPADGRRCPGVVLYSEIFQQTGPIRRTAVLLAGHGYVVAVPEVFHELEPAGSVLPYDQPGADRGNAHKIGKPVTAYDDDTRAVLSLLSGHAHCTGKLGAMGICMGGHLAFRAAMEPAVLATACLYATDIHKGTLGSGGDDSLARAGDIRGELCMIWGRQDPHVPAEGRALIFGRLAQVGAKLSWHELNAVHAFLRDEGPRYDPELALLVLRMVLDLFARTLRV